MTRCGECAETFANLTACEDGYGRCDRCLAKLEKLPLMDRALGTYPMLGPRSRPLFRGRTFSPASERTVSDVYHQAAIVEGPWESAAARVEELRRLADQIEAADQADQALAPTRLQRNGASRSCARCATLASELQGGLCALCADAVAP